MGHYKNSLAYARNEVGAMGEFGAEKGQDVTFRSRKDPSGFVCVVVTGKQDQAREGGGFNQGRGCPYSPPPLPPLLT